MESSSNADNICVLAEEPYPGITLDIAKEMCKTASCEKEIATVFAVAENKFWWYDDNIYDYDAGTAEYHNACMICRAWMELADSIKSKIFDILRTEGVTIPSSCQIMVLEPFMERNGYRNGSGWWIRKADKGVNNDLG